MNTRAVLRSVKGWLRREPQPFQIRVDVAGGGEKLLAVDMKDPRRWARAEETIAAMNAVRMEALDKKGVTLRAHVFEQDDDDEPAAQAAPGPNFELAQLGTLLERAADNAAKRYGEGYGKAFDMVLALAKSLVDGQTKLVQQVQTLSNKVAKLSAEAGGSGEPPDPSEAVPEMLMKLVMQKTGMAPGANGAGPKLDLADLMKFAQEHMAAQAKNGAATKEDEDE